MIKFQGRNLCERHKELNLKVDQAARSDVDFSVLKTIKENSDVDRIFKIDLASKCKNIDFIVEQLKCGDSLYISRALKCEWIFDCVYAHIFNPNYLHKSIFSTMSMKMKHKTLTALSIHIRDETRAQDFYEYCMGQNLSKWAYKFLMFTSESFKHRFLSYKENFSNIRCEHCIPLIGNSFSLADTYGRMGGDIKNLSYMYTSNESKYLDLYEKYTTPVNNMEGVEVGAKMSRSILKKHKNRIFKYPQLYLSMLKTSEVTKYFSTEDAKVCAMALLPEDVQEFWKMNYFMKYKYILDLIKGERFNFIKTIFTNKYPLEEFEMSKEFFLLGYYNFMDNDKKEIWALLHLEKHLGIIPECESYRLFELVRFSKTFEIIKQNILNALDWSLKSKLLNTLVNSAKSHKEIAEVLSYYYETHGNEKENHTQCFIEHVVEHHNVLDFDDACWSVFDKLLHSIGLYKPNNRLYNSCKPNKLLDISIMYHIITKKPFTHFDLSDYNMSKTLELLPHKNKLSEEKKAVIYDYMLNFYIKKIEVYESQVYNIFVKYYIRSYLKQLVSVKQYFENKDDYPNHVVKFMKLDLEHFKNDLSTNDIVLTEGYLIQCLKKDPKVIIDQFSLIQKNMMWEKGTIASTFFNKLKIYFSDDLAKLYLNLCIQTLNSVKSKYPTSENKRIVFANVIAIFKLGDESIKTELMEKHAKLRPSIDHWRNDRYEYLARMAICALQGYCRPPIPFSKTRLYMRGEYLRYSQGIINKYLMNLTPASLSSFIRLLLISPLSMQKIGIRLAFHVSKTSVRRNLVETVFEGTKHESVRKKLYKLIIDRIERKIKNRQETFHVLLQLTTDVCYDDDDEIFKYFRGNKVPENLRGLYLKTAWEALEDFPNTNKTFKHRSLVMKAMECNLRLLDKEFAMSLCNDFLEGTWNELKRGPKDRCPDSEKLHNATWSFLTEYVLDIPDDEKQRKTMEIVENVINKCFYHWNEKCDGEFHFQLFFKDFVHKLDENASSTETQYSRITLIFEHMLKSFEERFGITAMYSYFWDCQLLLLSRIAIDGREECDKEVHIRFGLELGKFIKKLKENNCFYTSFLRKIVGKILRCTESLCNLKTTSLTDRYVKILIAYGLTDNRMFETSVLALEILPQNLSNSPINEPELQEVIKRIKQQNNVELNALMNDKFIYSDIKSCKTT